MAEVFLARYAGPEGFEKQLVIKRVLPRISDSPSLLRMFFEEAKTQVSFSHGNLVSVFDFGRVDNDYFIAMDYVRGADLASLFAAERGGRPGGGERLAPPVLAHVGVEICRGLAYVHARGFVHRDVTPRNVLLSVDGEVKLSDFGLALAVQSPRAPGRPGTPSYMAPEQARGDHVDARADLYSLGLVLMEGLLERAPRADPDGGGRVDADVLADVSADGALGAILARAVAASPDARFAGAEEMLAALEAEIGRAGAGREALVRELAARVRPLAPQLLASTASDAPARPVTVRTAVESEPARESYFRDHPSPAFVESMLGAAAPPRRRAAWRAIAALAGGAALIAAGAVAVRRFEPQAAPPPPPQTQAQAETAARTQAQMPAPAQAPPAPARTAPGSRKPPPPALPPAAAREAPRALAATGHVRILCTPWCIPSVDGKTVGPDGRSFVVPVPAGRHLIEARRLDDDLKQQVDVAPGGEASAHFDFDDASR
jgi:serine/threonine-protein kinase